VLTVGVDLAAEAGTTAVAWIEWGEGGALLRKVVLGATDADILDAISHAGKAGIDCPLGWPDAFVAFVSAHQQGHVDVTADVAQRAGRRRLAWRLTDEVVREETGLIPLSVAADRIGHAAMRCAGLLAELARRGQAVDRSGAGVVVEVYPAACLNRWQLPFRRYKGQANTATLGQLIDALQAAAPWLDFGVCERSCRESDHATDAVIAALAARAASLGLATRPAPEQAGAARTEGWIALPGRGSSLNALEPWPAWRRTGGPV
jgi:predicted nuclease with RNAse H fold